jgi:hypothetical protein
MDPRQVTWEQFLLQIDWTYEELGLAVFKYLDLKQGRVSDILTFIKAKWTTEFLEMLEKVRLLFWQLNVFLKDLTFFFFFFSSNKST